MFDFIIGGYFWIINPDMSNEAKGEVIKCTECGKWYRRTFNQVLENLKSMNNGKVFTPQNKESRSNYRQNTWDN